MLVLALPLSVRLPSYPNGGHTFCFKMCFKGSHHQRLRFLGTIPRHHGNLFVVRKHIKNQDASVHRQAELEVKLSCMGVRLGWLLRSAGPSVSCPIRLAIYSASLTSFPLSHLVTTSFWACIVAALTHLSITSQHSLQEGVHSSLFVVESWLHCFSYNQNNAAPVDYQVL